VRTKLKLLFAAANGRPRFTISRADWKRVETEYGHPLSSALRWKLFAATREYLDWAQFELTAVTNSETAERVRAIKRAAHEFGQSILRCPTKIDRQADYYARSLVCAHMGLARVDGRDGLQHLALKIQREVSKGCDLALSQLRREEPSGFREGDMWGRWVRRLISILSAAELPVRVRKDTDKSKAAKPSAFVALVRELQACIPGEYGRSQSFRSDFEANIALSAAIARARTNRVTKSRHSLAK
jgi:hypothetical protein